MAKSARSPVTKKNNQALKRKVFGPAETARNERMNAKLLELAQQPKPPRTEMDVEQPAAKDPNTEAKENNEDVDMDAEAAIVKPVAGERSNSALKRRKEAKTAKIEKKRVRKPRNQIAFPKHPKKKGGKKR